MNFDWYDDLTISGLRVDLYECSNERPSEILDKVWPNNTLNEAWIPQTIADQIWVVFQFKSEIDRIEWEESLPENIKSWVDRSILKYAIDFGFKVYSP